MGGCLRCTWWTWRQHSCCTAHHQFRQSPGQPHILHPVSQVVGGCVYWHLCSFTVSSGWIVLNAMLTTLLLQHVDDYIIQRFGLSRETVLLNKRRQKSCGSLCLMPDWLSTKARLPVIWPIRIIFHLSCFWIWTLDNMRRSAYRGYRTKGLTLCEDCTVTLFSHECSRTVHTLCNRPLSE